MTIESFLSLFLDDPVSYFVALAIMLLLSIPLFRSFPQSIIDPFFINIIFAVFAYAVPIYLYIEKVCPEKHLYYFLISESVFWAVLLSYPNKRRRFRGRPLAGEELYAKNLFKIALFVYLTASLCTYVFVGIPLFMKSRQELYTGTGLGFLGKFSSFAQSYVLLYAYYQINSRKNRKYLLPLVFVIANCFLSGSKSSILTFAYWYFFYCYFLVGRKIKIKAKYLLLVLCFPVVVLLLYAGSSAGSVSQAFIEYMFRLVASGDGYWMSYPNDMISDVHIGDPMLHLFSGILAPLRLVSYDDVDPIIGAQLYWLHYPTNYGMIAGPNARLALTGWCYFGWGGIAFSAIAGLVVACCLYTSKKILPKSIFGVFLYGNLYMIALSLATDPSLFTNGIMTLSVNVVVYAFLVDLLSRYRVVKGSRKVGRVDELQ